MAAPRSPVAEHDSAESSAVDVGGDSTNTKGPHQREFDGTDNVRAPNSRQGVFASTSHSGHPEPESRTPLLESSSRGRYLLDTSNNGTVVIRSKKEVSRGEWFAVLSGCSIVSAWVLFMGVAWFRLRSKEERGVYGVGRT